jgi:quinohemoprotein ethanol dehydrogenase
MPRLLLKTLRLSLCVCVAGLAAWIVSAQQPKKIDNNALKNAGKTGEDWLTYGGNYAEWHYSQLKQIDTTNVKRLGLAWNWATESPAGANVETTPLVANGVMYGSLGWNVMFAIDARTGKYKWRWDPEIPREHIASLCCGPVNRGVAIYNGKIYEGLLDGTVVAVDQETGKPVWRTRVTNDADLILTSAVRVVKGKVIIGSSGAEQAVRGFFAALDADTGKEVWRFWTVPGDPSKGFEHPELKEAANGGRRAAAAVRCGMAWPTIRTPICSTWARAMAGRGTRTFAAHRVAITYSSRRLSR